jgi:ATP-dependent DNA helicase RecQ
VIDVLRGSNSERIRQLGHDRLSTFGIGRELPQEAWGSLLRQLVHLGFLEQDIANYSVLRLTEAARPLLRGEERLVLARPRVKTVAPKKGTAKGRVPERDEGLFQELRALRKKIADREGVPPFVVFGDATLTGMAASRPLTAEEFLQVSGVGQHKLGKYGRSSSQVLPVSERRID